jgi:hypothetical protein
MFHVIGFVTLSRPALELFLYPSFVCHDFQYSFWPSLWTTPMQALLLLVMSAAFFSFPIIT